MLDYPLRFEPILHDKIWGGTKLKERFNKKSPTETTGESWEISNVEGNISHLINGALSGKSLTGLLEEYGEALMGKKLYNEFGNKFPLLIKYIDAKEHLSVQLHPNDQLAAERHNSFGKTEMWYVMDADEGAKLNVGFSKDMTRESYVEALEGGKILDVLNFEEVQKGDSYFIKEGKVHAIGAGCMIAEIQQTSDITYRIYDWDRVDVNGKGRELHTELALDALDYKATRDFECNYKKEVNQPDNIASCRYFTTNFVKVERELVRNHSNKDSFKIYMCVEGNGEISVSGNVEKIKKGETLMIPACQKDVLLISDEMELLEVYV